MTPNSAPASALPVLSRAGEKGAVPLLIPASSDSWDLQSPPAWKEVPDSQVETVLGAPWSCLLGVSSPLPSCASKAGKALALARGSWTGTAPVCLGAGDCFLRSHPEAGWACS